MAEHDCKSGSVISKVQRQYTVSCTGTRHPKTRSSAARYTYSPSIWQGEAFGFHHPVHHRPRRTAPQPKQWYRFFSGLITSEVFFPDGTDTAAPGRAPVYAVYGPVIQRARRGTRCALTRPVPSGGCGAWHRLLSWIKPVNRVCIKITRQAYTTVSSIYNREM